MPEEILKGSRKRVYIGSTVYEAESPDWSAISKMYRTSRSIQRFCMPNVADDDFMASPSVVALLLRVVTARRLVKRLNLEVKAEIGDRLRPVMLS